jgi:hypothetical protein
MYWGRRERKKKRKALRLGSVLHDFSEVMGFVADRDTVVGGNEGNGTTVDTGGEGTLEGQSEFSTFGGSSGRDGGEGERTRAAGDPVVSSQSEGREEDDNE